MVMHQLSPPLIGTLGFIAVIGPLVWERTPNPCAAFDRAIARGDRAATSPGRWGVAEGDEPL